ncbi:hypothetical protein BOX15_Mlig023559g2 [Macrostomum lignano]|uniref:Uncharacterized protein n=1 Tax=Macrostomum lignano TaxID=282301 RepID=A0A267DXI7_9PLAT|nr:hypothetical protein BOX15_Mlig023559g2 [Macrostomum lignano]
MASATFSMPSQPLGGGGGSSGGGGTFSPLTMFECTISSATMLIDNMAVRDLLLAFRIVAQLNGHLMEVLDPAVQRLASVADEHALCPPPPPAFADSSSTSSKPDKAEKLLMQQQQQQQQFSQPATSMKLEASTADSDDDCVLMETDFMLDQSGLGGSRLGGGRSQQVLMGAGLSGLAGDDSALMGGSGGAGSGGVGELSNEWKSVLRRAYRVLKDETGSNVFDFALPYSAKANVQAANRVIDKALMLGRERPANLQAWRKAEPSPEKLRGNQGQPG